MIFGLPWVSKFNVNFIINENIIMEIIGKMVSSLEKLIFTMERSR